ncbi:MAG TPA: flagellar motor switch protein FliG [Chloroflexota bacterium]|nr:flagellar motor switch protein FliG [Chloroflexota bacterium]
MDQTDLRHITGRRKAAALLISLGAELAAQVLKTMREDEVELLTREIVRMERLPAEMKDAIMQQVYEDAMARQFITAGGSEYARDLLARTLGTQKAGELLTRATTARRDQPFGFMAEIEPGQLASVLEAEHPQTIALILSNLPHDLAGRILAALDFELQADVSSRIALMARTSPEMVKEVETVLKKRLATLQTQGFRTAGGVDFLVKVLNSMDTRSERAILESIEHNDPELAAEIRKNMFVFEDLSTLDDRSMQRLLRDINQKDLSMALRGASEDLKNRIFKNMSSRAAQTLRDDMAVSGPVRLRLVEEAQQRIINTVRTLQEAEEIVLSRGREDVMV